MPFARLTLTPSPGPEAAQGLAAELTNLIAARLGKRRDLTSVFVEAPGASRWTIGGVAHDAGAHLEVLVTAGTNTRDEKRAFIRDAMDALQHAIPDLASATYVVVKEVPGTDWGYDGRTQSDRAGDEG